MSNFSQSPQISIKNKLIIFIEGALVYAFIYNPWTKFPYTLLITTVVILLLTYARTRSLKAIGLWNNYSFVKVLATALLAFLLLEPVMDFIVQPLVNKLCHEVPDYSGFDKLKHDSSRYIKYISFVWISAAIGEEVLFRGYLFDRFKKLLPDGRFKTIAIILLTAILFSLPHYYQGTAGLVMTFFFGIAFGALFVKTRYNLWVNIIVHGLVDSLFLTLVYTDNLSYYEIVNKHLLGY
ncbi:CPBP family intramembrane metalloprotease [Mucilaginibacter limnophilus]|uniref:CPBP family intramembrane metalloprotease n=1 Tax=Mucilaginibacter limnophilus TaxID=1932778 RepID=A0A437MVH7_9SPHI|nr:CPBP family intramembrane glutamic endopeptidase [Mucilaginibacter limnophilus]RVU01633.1 CPBP family intramembrane metalloprotease [Mucilaginibacter limnophilus]